MKIVFVHGRAQQGKDPIELQQEWLNALNEGLKKSNIELPTTVEIVFPFYGNRLDELLKELDASSVLDVTTRGAPRDALEAEFKLELLYEIATGAGVTEAEIQSNFKGAHQEKGPLNWAWVQSIISALDKTPLGGSAINAFTRDVYVYLTNKSVRKAIDGIVLASLPDEPCVVVGHSLGSVVAYNVLRMAPPTVNVKKYITLGSPLGIKTIKKKLDTPLVMPSCVKSWFNAMDQRDAVALHPLDSVHFNISPPIKNKTNVNNHTDNRHGIVGYLNDVTVAKQIYDALSS